MLSFGSEFLNDLQSVFGDKHCIDASLISIPSKRDSFIMLESDKALGEPQNESIMVTKNLQKSIVATIHELAQFNEIECSYTLKSEEGPPHAKVFKVSLVLGDETYEGSGSSLKKAQQEAAALAFQETFYEHPPEKIKTQQEKSLTPTVALNNVATKLGIAVSYFLLNGKEEQTIDSYGAVDESYGKSKSFSPKWNSTFDPLRVAVEEAQISGPFAVRVKVGDSVFEGFGQTIQAARHDAALKALKDMERQALFKDHVCSREDSVEECKKLKDSVKSPIARVHEAAQISNLPVEFNVISESGKSHKKRFITECKLGDFVTEGEGRSKKESKREAAERMLEFLPQLQDNFNEKGIINGLKNKKKKNKKKNKVKKENVVTLMNSIDSVVSSFWQTDDSLSENSNIPKQFKTKASSSKSTYTSPKNKILEIGNKLNIDIGFIDLGKQENHYYSLVSLGLHPPHVCLGKATVQKQAHEDAALHGLQLLRKTGILDKTVFSKESKHFEEDFEVENEETFRVFDDFEEK
ncbi:double-stranded RNA-binding protein Staufen homolog isoform X2 [Tribolium madens]|nr:double-stranded RNA-binding protein Staufen homolog isoform X2 [Tribolium madens]